jgi:hypothetical protein
MRRNVLACAIAWLAAGVLPAQEATMRTDRQTRAPYRVVGEIETTDAAARTVTIRAATRRADGGTASDIPLSGAATQSYTITLARRASAALNGLRPGDRVEITCGEETTATTAAPGPQATPGPAPMGTGALPGPGTTGVGTTGTGISGERAPAPDSTPANAGRDAGGPGPSAADRFAGWMRVNCGVASAIARAPKPADRR